SVCPQRQGRPAGRGVHAAVQPLPAHEADHAAEDPRQSATHEGGGRGRSRDRRQSPPRRRAHDLYEVVKGVVMLTRGTEGLIEQSLLYPGGFISPLEIEDAVTRALAEDLGRAGGVTSIATHSPRTPSRTVMVARKAGTIAGLPHAAACFRKLAPEIEIVPVIGDGATVEAKTVLMHINGDARAVLSGARVRVNFVNHLSGIATGTAAYVRAAGRTKTRICCTRKTTPGLRALEKYAVRCGGVFNHRFGLDDAILIKDNHIAVAGGIRAVLERARAAAGHLVKIEFEVCSLEQRQEVRECGMADVVLIDNFDIASMKQAVAMVN